MVIDTPNRNAETHAGNETASWRDRRGRRTPRPSNPPAAARAAAIKAAEAAKAATARKFLRKQGRAKRSLKLKTDAEFAKTFFAARSNRSNDKNTQRTNLEYYCQRQF